MSSETLREQADRLRPLLRERLENQFVRRASKKIGVSHGTLSNFLNGDVPSEGALTRIESWIEDQVEDDASGRLPSFAGSTDSPAECLIAVLSHPELHRRLPGHSERRLVQAALGIALTEDFSPEEIDKLHEWRESHHTEEGREIWP